jgi:hypothetical protein
MNGIVAMVCFFVAGVLADEVVRMVIRHVRKNRIDVTVFGDEGRKYYKARR